MTAGPAPSGPQPRPPTVRTREASLALDWKGVLLPTGLGARGRVCDMSECDRQAYTLVSEPNGSLLLLCVGDAEAFVGPAALSASMAQGHSVPARGRRGWPWNRAPRDT